MSKEEKEVLIDSYRRLFANYVRSYNEIVSRDDLYMNRKHYEQCKIFCNICRRELSGMIRLLEDVKIFTCKESNEELGKIKVVFDVTVLIDLCYGEEEM